MRLSNGALVLVLSLLTFVQGAWARKATTAGSSGRARQRASRQAKKPTRLAKQKRARRSRRRYPPMTLIDPNRRRRNRLAVRVYDRGGRFRTSVVRQLTRFLRCRRTGRRRRIHPSLIRRIYQVSRHFGGRPIYVYSGYRHPSVSWTRGSYHTKGRAVDFRVKGISKRRLRDYLMKRFKDAGVGYYTRSPFIHFDIRRRAAFWIDFSGPGERPRYARNARRLLALERRGRPIRESRARRRDGMRGLRVRPTRRPQLARIASSRSSAVHSLPPLGPDPDRWARVVSSPPRARGDE